MSCHVAALGVTCGVTCKVVSIPMPGDALARAEAAADEALEALVECNQYDVRHHESGDA